MAASADPSGDSGESNENGNGTSRYNAVSVPDNSVPLRHNPGISVTWTPQEQSILEELLAKYATQNNIVRYAKIAMHLKDKTVRDVALRIRWMSKKENGKRRKEDHNPSRKSKDKKLLLLTLVEDDMGEVVVSIIKSTHDKVTESLPKSSQVPNHSNGPPYAQSMIASMESDDGISYKAIGGITGQLLEQNAQVLDQISANFSTFKIHDNINLLCQARNNILSILNDLNDMPEIMKHMPPLPVKLNEELANSILPRPPSQKK
ncbi:hypothetical protein LIER_02622 [Lithospermum erythrorhizon]|uniref:Myb-like domain-containing protein n=1 Tax=Lithospermum erythrorhizon TaxID=34254 RepID=A0AAV3NQ54_LITER